MGACKERISDEFINNVSVDGEFVTSLIVIVKVETLIIDDKLRINDDTWEIKVDVILERRERDAFEAKFVGREYGDIKNGLLLLEINKFAFDA